jgi:hypothetical protein
MRVLFLALGANRRRAVTGDAARVVAGGGEAVVVVDSLAAWQKENLDPAVRMVEVVPAESASRALAAERKLLFGAPRKALALVGRGPLRVPAGRVRSAYERRVATPLHRRALPAYRRLRPQARRRLIEQLAGPITGFDAVVVADPAAIVEAHLLASAVRPDARMPLICYSLDHLDISPAAG